MRRLLKRLVELTNAARKKAAERANSRNPGPAASAPAQSADTATAAGAGAKLAPVHRGAGSQGARYLERITLCVRLVAGVATMGLAVAVGYVAARGSIIGPPQSDGRSVP
jgi:hypothetical protein